MRKNYFMNLAYLLVSGFLVVASRVFITSDLRWIAFGVSTGVALAALANVLVTQKRVAQLGHAGIVVVALWSLIAALVFSGPVLGWLIFADALGVAAVALTDLVVHEFSTERVVHELQLAPRQDVPQRQYEAA
jgi:cytochrome b